MSKIGELLDRLCFSTVANEAAQILTKTVTVTDAQIKALTTTPITIVAAQGAGVLVQPVMALLFAKTTAGAYTNINAAAYLTMGFGSGDVTTLGNVPNDAAITNGSATALSDFIGGANNRRTTLLPFADTEGEDQSGPVAKILPSTTGVNTDLQIYINNGGSGALTGGNAANTLTVVACYVRVTVP